MEARGIALYPFVPSGANFTLSLEFFAEDGYWQEIDRKDLPGRFAGVRTRPPTDFPWGREIHIIDPGGVCWHVRQAKR